MTPANSFLPKLPYSAGRYEIETIKQGRISILPCLISLPAADIKRQI